MATPELVAHKLRRSFARDRLSPLNAKQKHGNVIEFDPNGKTSRLPDPVDEEAALSQTEGFLYDGVRAGRAIRAGLSRRSAALRPLPMEEVYLHVKDIKNSQLVRRPDPKEAQAWLRVVVCAFTLLGLVLLGYGPRSFMRESGYRLERLQNEYQRLVEINRQLKVRQAMLSDMRRVTELAASRGLTLPPPERVDWQDRTIAPPTDGVELAQERQAGPQ